ncbi:MAG: multicopper oxidase family protein, partial [Deltaproteobacteria bacterium]|nr:multicopper oxidase family protein [Deltaproteobacteria bacterium]
DPPIDGRPWALTPASDINPDPDIVEVELSANDADVELLAGQETSMWTYNGLFPGPLIEAKVGDRVIVHATNNLGEETTIHWHGLRIPAAMDGVAAMQNPVEPGETFTYEFVVQDALLAWYHPHIRSDEQVERGLQAPLIIRDPDAPLFGGETIAVLDDILLDGDGNIASFDANHMAEMSGRVGNTVLVNGHRRPVLEVRSGERQLFRVVNSANARTMVLKLPGHQLTWIGTDGGLLERPRVVDALALSPGERADFLFTIDDSPDATLDLEVAPALDGMMAGGMMSSAMIGRGTMGGDSSTYKALRIRVVDGEPEEFAALPDELRYIPRLATDGRARTVEFTGGMMGGGGMMDGGGGFSFNGERWPDVTALNANVGDVETWTLDNRTGMAHPFHLHGNRFQVIDGPGDPWPRAWKDNVLVPANARVTIAVALDGTPGRWMYHCHILEHAEGGMMGELDLE